MQYQEMWNIARWGAPKPKEGKITIIPSQRTNFEGSGGLFTLKAGIKDLCGICNGKYINGYCNCEPVYLES